MLADEAPRPQHVDLQFSGSGKSLGSVVVDDVQHTSSLLALPVCGLICIDLDLAFRPGGPRHTR